MLGIKVGRSLLVTGFGYEQDDVWITNMELFKEFTDISRGVRRLSAAEVDICHVALPIVEAHWEYRLKPWDTAAGVLIVEEARGKVTCMDGRKFSVFDRSILVSNCVLHGKLFERVAPATEKLKSKGIDFSLWYKPEDYTGHLMRLTVHFFFVFANGAEKISSTGRWSLIVSLVTFAVTCVSST